MLATRFSTDEQNFDFTKTDYPNMALLLLIAFLISVICGAISKQFLALKNSKYASVWSLYQCFFLKGNEDEPENGSLRLLYILWLFAGLITSATAAGELVAILAGQPLNFINTIRELAEATHIQIFLTSKPVQTDLKVRKGPFFENLTTF